DGRVVVGGVGDWAAPWPLTAGDARLALDDVDPYRGGHHAPAAPRLSEAEVARWRAVFADGWELIDTYAPERAAELAAGLRTLVPLSRTDAHSARSATISDAYGAFGLTLPSDGAEFAVMLVHEFQHSKLSGVLAVVPMVAPDSAELHFAPWRTDPRPVGGLFQGVYAFLGIADLWRRLRAHPTLAETAEREFATVREQVRWGLDSLAGSRALNPAGRRFTDGMRAAFDDLDAVALPPAVVEQASRQLRETHSGWQSRNAAVLTSGR
ncbi:HEXXH motif-containing putative peptide modification protein, partial [Actinoplanes sp. NPDC049596]